MRQVHRPTAGSACRDDLEAAGRAARLRSRRAPRATRPSHRASLPATGGAHTRAHVERRADREGGPRAWGPLHADERLATRGR